MIGLNRETRLIDDGSRIFTDRMLARGVYLAMLVEVSRTHGIAHFPSAFNGYYFDLCLLGLMIQVFVFQM